MCCLSLFLKIIVNKVGMVVQKSEQTRVAGMTVDGSTPQSGQRKLLLKSMSRRHAKEFHAAHSIAIDVHLV